MRDEYPTHMLRYFQEQNIQIAMESGDEELLRDYTCNFVACTGYAMFVLDSSQYETTPFSCMKFTPNPYTKDMVVDAFGATYYTVMQLRERYHKPVLVAEAGISATEEPGEDGVVHDDYRIAYYRENFTLAK